MNDITFPEVAGKTVTTVSVDSQFRSCRQVEIRFSDGTALAIEVWFTPALLTEAKLYRVATDRTIRVKKDYKGKMPCLTYD
jgi:hypothetical protein